MDAEGCIPACLPTFTDLGCSDWLDTPDSGNQLWVEQWYLDDMQTNWLVWSGIAHPLVWKRMRVMSAVLCYLKAGDTETVSWALNETCVCDPRSNCSFFFVLFFNSPVWISFRNVHNIPKTELCRNHSKCVRNENLKTDTLKILPSSETWTKTDEDIQIKKKISQARKMFQHGMGLESNLGHKDEVISIFLCFSLVSVWYIWMIRTLLFCQQTWPVQFHILCSSIFSTM